MADAEADVAASADATAGVAATPEAEAEAEPDVAARDDGSSVRGDAACIPMACSNFCRLRLGHRAHTAA